MELQEQRRTLQGTPSEEHRSEWLRDEEAVGVRVGTDDGNKLGRPDGTGLGTAVGSVEGPSVGTDVGSWRIANFSLKSYTGVTISSFESPLHTILMVYESPQGVSLLSVLIVVRVVGRG